MNPDLEFFLEAAFDKLLPTSELVGRVVIEPEYEADFNSADRELIGEQLLSLLHAQLLDATRIQSREGMQAEGVSKFQPLCKYVRRVFLHSEKADGAWIEVAPPGYWI